MYRMTIHTGSTSRDTAALVRKLCAHYSYVATGAVASGVTEYERKHWLSTMELDSRPQCALPRI